jgi:LAGLIDADG endonuclease
LLYKDPALLEIIKLYFKVGKVKIKKNKTKTNSIKTVHSIKDLAKVIIPHFDKYTLLTQKQADFMLFKQIFSIKVQGKHLTAEGLRKILALKASMNKGLNEKFKQEFPNLIASPRPEVLSSLIPFNLKWLLGFIEAEGSFFCLVRKNPSQKFGYPLKLAQHKKKHSSDLALMTKITEILGLGLTNKTYTRVLDTIDRKYEIDTFLPLVEAGLKKKGLTFKIFVQIKGIINKGFNRTEEALALITEIKLSMNKFKNEEKKTH